ncbi:sarcosine oxidase [Kribbella sp. VKM Ac-2527]|uniref:Sarcosine oxidase n=1 Tax=Kribbella caucasensis TaxID=2512215 RepID=A0A4R6KJZ4_9ACTN|nr:FAD-dependent oxidoreductase [Kribbella sp. VKM Ac-2527]TDO51281.1 sarcosine oxidase [Kribbella sp. VKM Ac-2527]
MTTYDVAVVGAGAMGSAAARALAAAGREVVVLEQYHLGHTRGGSHGGTRLFRLAVDDPETLRLAERARELWRELEAESGETLLEITGGLDHGVDQGTVETFSDLFGGQGIEHEVLDPDEAAERWPGMRFESRVLFQPGAGRLYADRTVQALQTVAASLGAEFRPHSPVKAMRVVTAGDGYGDGLVELGLPGGAVRARQVVVTIGPWAPKLLAGLVALPPLRITQEQPRFFTPVSAGLAWPSFVHWRRGSGLLGSAESYGLFESGSGVKVGLHATGPVVDPDSRDFEVEPSADRELLRYVEEWFPGLDPNQSTAISCLYDNTPSDNFVIDRVGPISVATGFCGQGFKFVPLIAEFLTDLVTGDGAAPPRYQLRSHLSD